MVYSRVDRTFHALADPTRRAILETLRSGERAISALAEPFSMSLPAVSKHIRVLEEAGLVGVRRAGRVRLCRLQPEPLREGEAWIARFATFWSAELAQVERFLTEGAHDPNSLPTED